MFEDEGQESGTFLSSVRNSNFRFSPFRYVLLLCASGVKGFR